MTRRVLSLGEALIDVVTRPTSTQEHVGGSLLNVAVGLGALGHPASICSHWGKDPRGSLLRQWAESAGVQITPGTDSAHKTSVAFARIDADGRANYEFDLNWAVPQLPDLEPFGHLHTGSIAATVEPGGSTVVVAAERMRLLGTVSYDPNIRPALMHSPDTVVDRVEHLVSLSDVVKTSDEDLDWLYPGVPVENIMRRWVKTGPAMVVVTRGSWGAYARLAHNRDMLHIDQTPVTVGDTVGAGDSFMAGLISGLLDAGLLGSPQARDRLAAADWPDVQPALLRAIHTSALTVSRSGAYAPSRAEVHALHALDPALT
ncbi:carbohydrate kinase [Rhodococcus sp. ACS1]|uniref:Fructokinase n=1 Tax=Rhodococcus koreensis TaxID=99653 RepID=A0A1H4IEG9_9NOCA|nr:MULTISPECIES: carbohydrate kinase [Rhodococcus]MDF3311916.1 carbohydrate kinase [Rhodococcus sp. T2V]PBC40139.1 carbohydrate kinase [Rhodococcus sp. ACS1]SEB32323.1 fructokinase [Rhodococcus koreensis]